MHILFITTANLASNPRLVKEVDLAITSGHSVSIVCFRFHNWSSVVNEAIKERLPASVRVIEISAERKPVFPWFFSTGLQLLCSILMRFGVKQSFVYSQSLYKRTVLLTRVLNRFAFKPDFVIAHNPGSFFPALRFAEKHGSRLGYDVEDYHPGETNDTAVSDSVKWLLKEVLPQADYCSYASPLIAAAIQQDIPCMQNKQLIILNGFHANEFVEPVTVNFNKLKFVWFSQYIDVGRGLEKIIPVINRHSSIMELHLVGMLSEAFEQMYLQNKEGVFLYSPMHQKELHLFLSGFDAGLATDIPVNRNRDIALTNKILAYTQAGLCIAAMHTSAQDLFLSESNLLYVQMENSEQSIEEAFLHLNELKRNGKLDKKKQYDEGKKYSWEYTAQTLTETWNN